MQCMGASDPPFGCAPRGALNLREGRTRPQRSECQPFFGRSSRVSPTRIPFCVQRLCACDVFSTSSSAPSRNPAGSMRCWPGSWSRRTTTSFCAPCRCWRCWNEGHRPVSAARRAFSSNLSCPTNCLLFGLVVFLMALVFCVFKGKPFRGGGGWGVSIAKKTPPFGHEWIYHPTERGCAC